jgi:Uma2 family endonuclease
MSVEFVVNVPRTRFHAVSHLTFRGVGKKFNDKDFEDFCRDNPELKVEQNAEGEIVIMPPTGGTTGNRNFSLIGRFYQWASKNKQGFAFDSSTVFVLPNGAKRSPDLSWVKIERWNALTKEQQDKFPPLCPDFVVELRSKTDSLKTLQAKMQEYIENGSELGWLIDPIKRKVHVYRPNKAVEILDSPTEISGEPLLPKFTLELKDFWE